MIRLEDGFLRGSYPPLVTPFNDGEVDYDKFAELVEFQVGHGSHGVVVGDATAEPTTLTIAERAQLIEVAVDAADGRLPVLAAVGAASHQETIALVTQAAEAGADALLVVTPPYVQPPQRGLVEYYLDLGRQSDLPLLLHHIPGRAAVDLQLDTIERIAERTPHLVGLEYGDDDVGLVTRLLQRFGFEFRLFAGLDQFGLPLLALGAAGVINAAANLAPRKVAQLYEHAVRGAFAEARALHYQLFELGQALHLDASPIPLKYMMKRIGLLAENEHRLPLLPATGELEERLDGVLHRAGLIGAGSGELTRD